MEVWDAWLLTQYEGGSWAKTNGKGETLVGVIEKRLTCMGEPCEGSRLGLEVNEQGARKAWSKEADDDTDDGDGVDIDDDYA